MDKQQSERRKHFFYQVTLGNVFSIFTVIGAALGLYLQIISDVQANKQDIAHMKIEEVKKENSIETSRKEIKQEIKDVKQDVRRLDDKLDKILFEVQKRRQ